MNKVTMTGNATKNHLPITTEQLQPFYDNILELLDLIQDPGGYGSDGYLVHIDIEAHKLATALKTHMENLDLRDIIFDDNFKFRLPLFTGDECKELKKLAVESKNTILLQKVNNNVCVYDFTNDM